jgi:hypothetical protein
VSLPPPPASPERPTIPPDPEAISAATPSRAPLVIGLFIVAGLLIAAGLAWRWVGASSACAGADHTSERFGYCIAVPDGWQVARTTDDERSADQYFLPEGNATVMIQAVETGRGLDAFADHVRGLQAHEGLTLSEVRSTQVEGVAARRWDATAASGAGSLQARTVVFERDGIAWRVQFADTGGTFDTHVADLSRILASWRFR